MTNHPIMSSHSVNQPTSQVESDFPVLFSPELYFEFTRTVFCPPTELIQLCSTCSKLHKVYIHRHTEVLILRLPALCVKSGIWTCIISEIIWRQLSACFLFLCLDMWSVFSFFVYKRRSYLCYSSYYTANCLTSWKRKQCLPGQDKDSLTLTICASLQI